MIKDRTPCLFLIFYFLLLISTYFKIGNYYLLITAVIFFFLSSKDISLRLSRKNLTLYLFIGYYVIISLFGLILDTVGIRNFVELILKYILMPWLIIRLIPQTKTNLEKCIWIIRKFISGCAIYGLIEFVLKYNILEKVVKIDSRSWILAMNGATNYQSSSLFLHYNYYGCILVVGWLLGLLFPYKNRIVELLCRVLIIEQILMCQSRIAWISFIIVSILYIIRSAVITNKLIQRIIVIGGLLVVVVIFNPTIIWGIAGFVTNRFGKIFQYGFQDGSLGQRLGTLLNWPEYFQKYPVEAFFGTGYQSTSLKFMQEFSYFKGYSTADCMYTILIVETGIVGFIVFTYTIINLIRKQYNSSCLLLWYGIIIFLIESVTLDIVSNDFILVMLYMIIAVGYRIEKSSSSNL